MSVNDINDRRKRQRTIPRSIATVARNFWYKLINNLFSSGLETSDSDSDSSVSSLSTTESESDVVSNPENDVVIYPSKHHKCGS